MLEALGSRRSIDRHAACEVLWATMTTLRLRIDHDGNESTLVFHKFPIRIGRDDSNECRLEFAFVSRTHCRLELQEGRLVLRDEESRQGTWVRRGEERLLPTAVKELAEVGYEFQIGALHFRAELQADVATHVIKPAPAQFAVGTVDLGGRADDAVAFRRIPKPPIDDLPPVAQAPSSSGGPLEASLQRALQDYAEACGALEELLQKAIAREPSRATQLTESVQRAGSALRMVVAASVGIEAAAKPAQSAEVAALLHVQDLARQSVPYLDPPSTAKDVTAFAGRLKAVLATALEGIVSLRLAHRCETSAPPTEPSRALLTARLLDWSTDRSAIDELRGDLREMISHHNRLIDDVNAGWDELLCVLDPIAMERTCGATRWSPFRHRALWNEFARRYDGLVRERRTGALGPTFASVVRALRGAGGRPSRPVDERGGLLRYGILAA